MVGRARIAVLYRDLTINPDISLVAIWVLIRDRKVCVFVRMNVFKWNI